MKNFLMLTTLTTAQVLASAGPMLASAQEPPIPHSCNATPAQLQKNKDIVLEFSRPDTTMAQRIAMVDPGYVQHNPRHVKLAAEEHVSGYEDFKRFFTKMAAAANQDKTRTTAPSNSWPQPVIVMSECDLVTLIAKTILPDPTAVGRDYVAFDFDTYRVRNGKLVEHWDGATISEESMQRVRSILKTPTDDAAGEKN